MFCRLPPKQVATKLDTTSYQAASQSPELEGRSARKLATEASVCPSSDLTRNGGEGTLAEGGVVVEGGAAGGVTAGLLVCTRGHAGEPRALAARANIVPSVARGGIKVGGI